MLAPPPGGLELSVGLGIVPALRGAAAPLWEYENLRPPPSPSIALPHQIPFDISFSAASESIAFGAARFTRLNGPISGRRM